MHTFCVLMYETYQSGMFDADHPVGTLVLQAEEDSRLSDLCSRVVMTGMSSVEEKLQHLVAELQTMCALVQHQVSELK